MRLFLLLKNAHKNCKFKIKYEIAVLLNKYHRNLYNFKIMNKS